MLLPPIPLCDSPSYSITRAYGSFQQQSFWGGPDHNKGFFYKVGHLTEIHKCSCCCYSPTYLNFIQLPVIQTQPPVHQPPVDQSTQSGVSAPEQVTTSISAATNVQSQVDVRAWSGGIVAPQSPTQVVEPNTETLPQQTSRPKTPNQEKGIGVIRLDRRENPQLCLLKRSRKPNEATVSPSVSSQTEYGLWNGPMNSI